MADYEALCKELEEANRVRVVKERELADVKAKITDLNKRKTAIEQARAANTEVTETAEQDAKGGSLWNVGSWQWEERNLKTGAFELMRDMIMSQSFEAADFNARVTEVTKLTGDAFMNIRKGKKIVGWEIHLKFSWEGEYAGEAVGGTVSVPDICDDSEEDDFDVSVTSRSSSAAGNRAKELMRKQGGAQIKQQLLRFGKRLRELAMEKN